MNAVTPQATTLPTPVPAGAPTTTPVPGIVNQSAPPEAVCDTFTPRPLNNLQLMWRNIIYGTLPVNLPAPAECPNK